MERPEPVLIVDYSTDWPNMFAAEKRALLSALQPDAVAIEHIGSTSVGGLGAKPIIDILAGAKSLPAIEEHIEHITALGYLYVPAFESTIPERRFFVKPGTGAPTFHLHAVSKAGGFWTDHLAFRDAPTAAHRSRQSP